MCKTDVAHDATKKLLGQRYCLECISKARSERRKKLKATAIGKKKADGIARRRAERRRAEAETEAEQRRAEAEEAYKTSLEGMAEELAVSGPSPLDLPSMPLRLKRNEQIYFLAGKQLDEHFSIAIVLTNQRLFFVKTGKPLSAFSGKKSDLRITRGIKTISLSTVIAIDTPESNRGSSNWEITLHLDKGKDVLASFRQCKDARLFYVLLAEMVDRLNDPVDESVFSPKRERIPDDVKVAVWRRDGGICAQCGSRNNLEYDHIIPVSKGGSNTLRNIELLCETCNRKKSNQII